MRATRPLAGFFLLTFIAFSGVNETEAAQELGFDDTGLVHCMGFWLALKDHLGDEALSKKEKSTIGVSLLALALTVKALREPEDLSARALFDEAEVHRQEYLQVFATHAKNDSWDDDPILGTEMKSCETLTIKANDELNARKERS